MYRGEFVMKTLITALAVTAILATSAVAKTQRTRAAHIQPNNSLSHNSVSHSSGMGMLNHNCRFHDGETDPDPRIRLQLVRDCREHENVDAE
jgi:2-methylaconitate cis-trans-isomerase PrpF